MIAGPIGASGELVASGLTGLTVDELAVMLASRARALAAARWIYGDRPWTSEIPAALPGIQPAAWARLRDRCALPDLRIADQRIAADGTIKLLIEVFGGAIETVLIPARGRSTVCVSSQLGCTRSCRFCATATLGFGRNLGADEIVAQYLIARRLAPAGAPASNVVFMGMGEPMDNLDEVLRAVRVLTQVPAPQLGHAQVTVSTSGVLPGIRRFLAESSASLALSLNAVSDARRTEVMPQTRTWPISALLEVLRADRATHPGRVHFIEYVVFGGVNDADADAHALVGLLAGIHARVNLIPYNPPHGAVLDRSLVAPARARIEAFHQVVSAAGVRCLIRWPRGADIAAACGQLAQLRVPSP